MFFFLSFSFLFPYLYPTCDLCASICRKTLLIHHMCHVQPTNISLSTLYCAHFNLLPCEPNRWLHPPYLTTSRTRTLSQNPKQRLPKLCMKSVSLSSTCTIPISHTGTSSRRICCTPRPTRTRYWNWPILASRRKLSSRTHCRRPATRRTTSHRKCWDRRSTTRAVISGRSGWSCTFCEYRSISNCHYMLTCSQITFSRLLLKRII